MIFDARVSPAWSAACAFGFTPTRASESGLAAPSVPPATNVTYAPVWNCDAGTAPGAAPPSACVSSVMAAVNAPAAGVLMLQAAVQV